MSQPFCRDCTRGRLTAKGDFFTCLFIITLVANFNKIIKEKSYSLFLLWIAFPYIVFTLFANKYLYYTMAYLPAIAYISAYGLMAINKKFLRRAAIILVISVGLAQFFSHSYVNYKGKKRHRARYLYSVESYAAREDWKQGAIISRISEESHMKEPKIGSFFICSPNQKISEMMKNAAKLSELEPSTQISYADLKYYYSHVLAFYNYAAASYVGLSYYLRLNDIPYELVYLPIGSCTEQHGHLDFIISPVRLEKMNICYLSMGDYSIIEEFLMPDESKVYLYGFKGSGG